MRLRKSTYLTGVASVALIAGMAVSPVQAFDDVDWQWEKNVDDNVVKEARITSLIQPSGLVDIQKFQLHVGDLQATSDVDDVTYDRVGENGDGGSQTVTIDGRFEDELQEGEPSGGLAGGNFSTDGEGNAFFTVDSATNAQVSNLDVTPTTAGPEEYEITFAVDPTSADGELDRLDATIDLPEVESSATSVANNQTINTQVHTELNDGQVAYGSAGDGDGDGEPVPPETITGVVSTFEGTNDGIDNEQMSAALAAAVGNMTGTIDKAEVGAVSDVDNITNASVDSSATAVTNNMTATLNAQTGDDAVMIADLTQAGFSDNTAVSAVTDVSVNNFSNLRQIDPVVSSTATAVGNNLSITVTSPADGPAEAANVDNSVDPD